MTAALQASAHGPDYGYLWWLNTKGGNYPGLPVTAYGAQGAGSHTITILPDEDLVVVWRWHAGNAAEFASRVLAALGTPSRKHRALRSITTIKRVQTRVIALIQPLRS